STTWSCQTFADRCPGAKALDVGRTPVPLDFLAVPATASPNDVNLLAGGFRDSFQNCIRVKGDVALANLREVVASLLHARHAARGALSTPKPISLRTVLDALRERNEDQERGRDSIDAKLSELVEFNLFEPQMA